MQYTQHENETGESLAESTQKLFPIDARTVQYFGECFLYNANSIFAYSNKTSSNAWSTQGARRFVRHARQMCAKCAPRESQMQVRFKFM